MDLSTLTANLKRLRVARGLSQGDVADAAEMSRVGYRNIESGGAAPRVDTLLRVAKALDVKLEDLFVPVRELTAVRFRANRKMTTRGELLADVARWLDDYNELEDLLGDRLRFELGDLCVKVRRLRGPERPAKAAALAREAFGLESDEAVRDISGLLEGKGIKVFTPELASEGFFGLSVAPREGGPAIVVNVWDRLSVERWIFTAAHELGHLLLHLDAYDVAKSEEDSKEEKEADVFASYFLMPPDLFEQKLAESKGLELVKLVFKLKRFFGVSWKSVLYRISSMTPDGGQIWGKFQSEYRRLTGRTVGATEEPDGMGPGEFRSVAPQPKVADEPEHLLRDDFVEGRLSLLVRRAVEADEISIGRAAEILRVDLPTMRAQVNSWVG
jgi:Zn-dependent peptidase ImmA (M78 family)/DNA-binding XRE family transcriptional regulator